MSRREARLGGASLLLAAPALGAVVFFFILPYGAALWTGLKSGGFGALSNPALRSIALFTIRQAFLSVLCALALGLPGAWIIGSGTFRASPFLRSAAAIPFAMPSILVALGFTLFFGNAGWLNRAAMAFLGTNEPPLRILYRPEAIILAHGFFNFPLALRLVGNSLSQVKRAYAPASAALGASGFVSALTILFPLALPSLFASAILIFLYSFTSFAVVLVLGGGPGGTTLAVEIYRHARTSLDFGSAGALAILETLIALLAFAVYSLIARRGAFPAQDLSPRPLEGKDRSFWGTLFQAVYLLVLALLVAGPLLSIPLESFLHRSSWAASPEFSLLWWRSLGNGILPALGRSLLLACLSASAAVIMGTFAAGAVKLSGDSSPLGRTLRFLTSAPLISSGIVLGLGWILLYGRGRSRGLAAAAILQGIAALPFAFNAIFQGLQEIPQNALNAASVAGAPPALRFLTLEIPLIGKRIFSAWGFAAALSLGELNAIIMLGLERWETLPLFIYRAIGAYRYGPACAAGTLLTLCCFGALLLSEGAKGAFRGT